MNLKAGTNWSVPPSNEVKNKRFNSIFHIFFSINLTRLGIINLINTTYLKFPTYVNQEQTYANIICCIDIGTDAQGT
jgi:hypothetical protein